MTPGERRRGAGEKSFHALDLLNPGYLWRRARTVSSGGDLLRRIRDLGVLGGKLLAGRYGEKYWASLREEPCLPVPDAAAVPGFPARVSLGPAPGGGQAPWEPPERVIRELIAWMPRLESITWRGAGAPRSKGFAMLADAALRHPNLRLEVSTAPGPAGGGAPGTGGALAVCAAPWTQLELVGHLIRPCRGCGVWVGDARTHTLGEAWNSPAMRVLRLCAAEAGVLCPAGCPGRASGGREPGQDKAAGRAKERYLETGEFWLFRPWFLLDPVFLYRRGRTIRSLDDFLSRARNLGSLVSWWLTRRFGLRREEGAPGALDRAAGLLRRGAGSVFQTWLLADGRALWGVAAAWRRAGLERRRARGKTGTGADSLAVEQPESPVERHPPCPIQLSWNIHLSCNYDCPYCWFHGDWKRYAPVNVRRPPQEWLERWERFNGLHGAAQMDITGGEPFTYPGFLEILAGVSRRNVVNVTTNLHWEPEPFIGRISPDRVSLSVSFHPAYADARRYLEKAAALRRAGFHTTVSCVAYPGHLHRLAEYGVLFRRQGIFFEVQPFRGSYLGLSYPEAYGRASRRMLDAMIEGRLWRELLPDAPPIRERLVQRIDTAPLALEYQLGKKSTRGRLCNTGRLYFRLQPHGDIVRCAQGGFVGNFFDDGFELWKEPRPCPFGHCDCLNEIAYAEGCPFGPPPP